MTEYLDELIHLFRKVRTGAFIQFQDEEVKNHLINSLPSEILAEVQGYLDLMAGEITQKYDLLHSQREALGITSATGAEKVLHTVQEKSVGNDEINIIDKLEQIFAYKDSDHQNKYLLQQERSYGNSVFL